MLPCSGCIVVVFLSSRKSRRITIFLFQKAVYVTLHTEGSILNIQQVSVIVSGCSFFLHGGIQCHTFASSSMRDAFCQSAPLQPSATQQQNVMGYWWESSSSTATPPTSTSDVVGQHNKIGGILGHSFWGSCGTISHQYLKCFSA